MKSSSDTLQSITQEINQCKHCPLYKTATQAVPGEGNLQATVVFIGEAPGFYEDQQGIPFVGRSGKLLDFCLEKIGLQRSDVWIGNILKHRPPQNRNPLPQEISACKPFLNRQLKLIQPKFVVTLGRFAMEKFISGVYISHVHGKPRSITWESNNFFLFPMYHPAAALRNPQVKKDFYQDFKHLKHCLDHPPKKTSVSGFSPILSSKKTPSADSKSKINHNDNHQNQQMNLL